MDLKDLGPVAIAFVFIAIVIGIGADVLGNIQTGYYSTGCNTTNVSGCGFAHNTTRYGLQSNAELGSWLPTIALVISAAVVIGVLAYFRA